MQTYLPTFLSYVTKNPKNFLLSFLKARFPILFFEKAKIQPIYIDYMESCENFRIDFFIPIDQTIINIQFSNSHIWKQTTNNLLKDFQNDHYGVLMYHYKVQSMEDVLHIKKETFPFLNELENKERRKRFQ